MYFDVTPIGLRNYESKKSATRISCSDLEQITLSLFSLLLFDFHFYLISFRISESCQKRVLHQLCKLFDSKPVGVVDLCLVIRDWSLITGRGGYKTGVWGEGGHVKFYPYEKGGGRKKFKPCGRGGTKSVRVFLRSGLKF